MLKPLLMAALLGVPACSDTAPLPQPARAAAQPFSNEVAAAIRASVADAHVSGAPAASERAALAALYEPQAYSPLWTEPPGRPNEDARDALALVERAADDGLARDDYRYGELASLASLLQREATPPVRDVARFDAALSVSVLRLFSDLHLGRVDPRSIGFRLHVPAEAHDFPALLLSSLAAHGIRETASALQSPLAQYRSLGNALLRYRSLAQNPPSAIASLSSGGVVRPGQSFASVQSLFRLLVSMGDLPADAPVPAASALYEGAVVEGVRRFQRRHGLDEDGILGRKTHAALAVPLAWRVRQIELALERLRWLPDIGERRLVAINIPMFQLWGWDSIPPDGAPSFMMSVIVGRALGTQTPVFVEDMRELIFRPYWNVPVSILREDMLPAIRRDPDYLRRENMEIVRGEGDDASPVEATPENLARLARGLLRLRQRPGPQNALGLVKFVFPNAENVYMHATPAQALFARSRRDFSHGCVRVEDPVRLAEWVLAEQPEWTRDRILSAMAGPQTLHVAVKRPIQVILFYTTAAVMPDGAVRFAEDIYGHDARLDAQMISSHQGLSPR